MANTADGAPAAATCMLHPTDTNDNLCVPDAEGPHEGSLFANDDSAACTTEQPLLPASGSSGAECRSQGECSTSAPAAAARITRSWFWARSKKTPAEAKAEALQLERKRKDTIQFVARRNARSAHATMQGIFKRRIFVNADRAETLFAIYDAQAKAPAGADSHAGQLLRRAASDSAVERQRSSYAAFDAPAHREDNGARLAQTQPLPAKADTRCAQGCDVMPSLQPPTLPDGSNSGSKDGAVVPLLLINFTDEQSEQLEASLGPEDFVVARLRLEAGNWTELMRSVGPSFKVPPTKKGAIPQVVAVRVDSEEVSEYLECVLAAHWLANRVVLTLVDCPYEQHAAVHEHLGTFTNNTWPVFNMLFGLQEYCRRQLKDVLALRRSIRADVYGLVCHLARVNYLWHGMKRAPVALVPFGVTTVNFVGLTRLVGRILAATGMLMDGQAKKAGITLAGKSYAKIYLLDNASDLYQAVTASSIVLSITNTLATGGGVAAAAETLSVADFALLGSASVVTGIIAAIGAALTRPQMVSGLTDMIATLQTVWLLFPQTRRGLDDVLKLDSVDPESQKSAESIARIAFSSSDMSTTSSGTVWLDDAVVRDAAQLLDSSERCSAAAGAPVLDAACTTGNGRAEGDSETDASAEEEKGKIGVAGGQSGRRPARTWWEYVSTALPSSADSSQHAGTKI